MSIMPFIDSVMKGVILIGLFTLPILSLISTSKLPKEFRPIIKFLQDNNLYLFKLFTLYISYLFDLTI